MSDTKLPEGFTGTAPIAPGATMDATQLQEAIAPEQEAPEPDAPVLENDEDGNAPQTHCQRCGWELASNLVEKVTDDDKRNFVRCMLGEQRFTKDYILLGGELKATFRAIRPVEMDLIVDQLKKDTADGKLNNEAEYLVNYSRYMLVCSLQAVSFIDKGQSYPEVIPRKDKSEEAPEENGPSALPTLYKELTEDWQEALHAILLVHMRQFEKLYDILIHRAYDPDFWPPTVG